MIAVAWAALDVREVVHQFDESRSGIAVLHLTAAALAGVLAARARRSGAMPGVGVEPTLSGT